MICGTERKMPKGFFPFQQMESSMEFGYYKSLRNININMINDYGCRQNYPLVSLGFTSFPFYGLPFHSSLFQILTGQGKFCKDHIRNKYCSGDARWFVLFVLPLMRYFKSAGHWQMDFSLIIASLNWDQQETITLTSIPLHKLGGDCYVWCFELSGGLHWLARSVSCLAREEVCI